MRCCLLLLLLPFLVMKTTATESYPNGSNEVLLKLPRERSYRKPCRVPRYAPYFWVKDVSKTEIILGVTDPNKLGTVSGYTAYYWGHKFGVESTFEEHRRVNRDYGERNISTEGPFKISGLKAGFLYCADITAFNDCGHGPFCIACFENIATLDK